ncbi:MAG: hypothetical protein JSW65_03635 [Candidatus Bipolaricaulota bacterium]|nr:MAG: hypothetical protein JSW65_03635 [Candidatus Bipolaricaulota bacterium]
MKMTPRSHGPRSGGTSRTLRILALATVLTVALIGGAAAQNSTMAILPTPDGAWRPPDAVQASPLTLPVRLSIAGAGNFSVDPGAVERQRPEVFREGRFSVFDVLAHLGATEQIDLEYHFDEELATHVVDSINGEDRWWYEARYDGGWFERNVTRMDLYPIQNGTVIRFDRISRDRLDGMHETFREEALRLAENDGAVILPRVAIEGPRGELLSFENVAVSAHDVRSDLFQPGVITALDILLSLGEQGHLTKVGLTWYEFIGSADPVEHYFIELVEGDDFLAQAFATCGFVYEVGPSEFAGFAGSHIHVATDARVLVSPDYALWFWLCL